MLAVIPDIHADPDRLARSLAGASDRRIAFLGDLIDANAHQEHRDDRAVLNQARALIDSGRAIGILGNHEMNAIRFHRFHPDGTPLRA